MAELTQTAKKYADTASQSPLPAWALSTSLVLAGLNSHKPVEAKIGSSGGSSMFSKRLAQAKPTRTSCFAFGATQALGGWIIYDGDLANGAGFTFAWSVLYLIVNGAPSFKSLFAGRVSPLALSTLALGNSVIYGKQFFWPSAPLSSV